MLIISIRYYVNKTLVADHASPLEPYIVVYKRDWVILAFFFSDFNIFTPSDFNIFTSEINIFRVRARVEYGN